MQIEKLLGNIMDPLGVPFYPLIFQILMILTFAIHITFVNLLIGSSILTLYSYLKKDDKWNKLTLTLTKTTTVAISFAILFGVAPLLFIQVIYDFFWYSSNMLSAWWMLAFIGLLALGYFLIYIFYLNLKSKRKGILSIILLIAIICFLIDGFIMHFINYQILHPEKWASSYINGDFIKTSGTLIIGFSFFRFLHFIVPSFAIVGLFLMLYSSYFEKRDDFDSNFLKWCHKKGYFLTLYATVVQFLVGILWLLKIPANFKFYFNPAFLISLISAIILLVLLISAYKNPSTIKPVVISIIMFITILLMSVSRETLRTIYLSKFNYSIYKYKINLSWGSTLLFFATFLMVIFILSYIFTVTYKAGTKKGEYRASQNLNKWGNVAIIALLIWFAIILTVGIIFTVKNLS